MEKLVQKAESRWKWIQLAVVAVVFAVVVEVHFADQREGIFASGAPQWRVNRVAARHGLINIVFEERRCNSD